MTGSVSRRGFLKALGLVVGGGLVVGPAVLEAWDRLTWRRTLFPGFTPPTPAEIDALMRRIFEEPFLAQMRFQTNLDALFTEPCRYREEAHYFTVQRGVL